MKEEIARRMVQFFYEVAHLDARLVTLVILLVVATIVLDAVFVGSKEKKAETGISQTASVIALDGSKTLEVRNYVSEIQGLAGRPDAIIREHGYLIPIETKPLARKLRDRYVAQLLVYMRLIEEFEGKKPPYGYLILGPKCRRFRIENSPERQAWLQKMLDEMREILQGASARAEPDVRKCERCAVREACVFRHDVKQPAAKSLVIAKVG